MIVLTEESPNLKRTASSLDLSRFTQAAKIAGFKTYYIPQELPQDVTAEDVFFQIPKQNVNTIAFWVGFIPHPDHYEEIYNAALQRNIQLINSPVQFRLAEEFDRFYPFIEDLTAGSEIVTNPKECEEAAQKLRYPIFVKGTIQSMKAKGLKACVANNLEELRKISDSLFAQSRRSLGKVILREYLDLRYTRKGPGDFPLGREYRAFVLDQKVVGLGYYWEDKDELSALNANEESIILELAREVSRRLRVPFLTVDIGQLQSGEWRVIEVGDGQFSGVSQVPILKLWNNLHSFCSLNHQ